jgi:hypothetical protein
LLHHAETMSDYLAADGGVIRVPAHD